LEGNEHLELELLIEKTLLAAVWKVDPPIDGDNLRDGTKAHSPYSVPISEVLLYSEQAATCSDYLDHEQ
jgi:hypothetical protein